MKKKILFCIGSLFVIGLIMTFSLNLTVKDSETDILLTNVEALAQGESGGGSGCGGQGTYLCNGQAIYYGEYY